MPKAIYGTVKYTLKANVYLLLLWWGGYYTIYTHSMQFIFIFQEIELTQRTNGQLFFINWQKILKLFVNSSYISYIYISPEKNHVDLKIGIEEFISTDL
jgi:hypothetical protein